MEALAILGQSGVDLFFLVSGFLIYGHVLVKQTSYTWFMKRRLRRIYPAFGCMLLVYTILHFAVYPLDRVPQDPAAAAVFILQSAALLPGIFDIPPLFSVAWSLSYEMLFYCTIPVLVAVTGLRRWRPSWRMLFFAVLGAIYGW